MANTKITNPELFNLGDSTSATQLPVMTTTQRIAMNAPPTLNIDYLVVAGGGGGARSAFTTGGASGGGGGAGEYLYKTAQTITTGGSGYTVTVGDSGNAGVSGVSAINGGNSVFIDTTLGGGYGGTGNSSTYSPGASGGSGGGSGINGSTVYAGGSSTATSPGLGNAGGASTSASSAYGAGGGGGAGTAGSNGTSSTGGNGGTGVQNSITGTATFYAGGGGGGSFNNNNVGSGGSGVGGNANARAAGSPGVSNTGSGGGGGSYSGSAHTNGAAGGSGIVILRYTTADIASYTATGLTPTEDTTTVSGQTILSFTTVGTGTITFTSPTPTGTISTGEMIFNSTTDKVEYWDGTKWYGITYEVAAETPYNNVLYTGSGDTTNGQSITGIGFKPDLLWFKSTGTTYYNVLYDSIRGTNAAISSNLTNSTYSNYNRLQSFDNDGFTIKANNTADLWKIDRSGQPFVAWCFKAGGAAVANTDGDVESQVSANAAGGFSIVKGTGSSSGVQSVGHGLSSAPEFVMVKNINATDNWFCLVPGLTSTNYYMRINTTDGQLNAGTPIIFADSTTVSVRQNSMGSWGNLIAYCFASVPGYSKVGSFVGTGAAGLKIDLDFEPAYILTKRVSSSGASWAIIDNKRSTGSNKNNYLQANSSAAEATSSSGITFNTDGFTFNGSSFNTNGATHMYYAIA